MLRLFANAHYDFIAFRNRAFGFQMRAEKRELVDRLSAIADGAGITLVQLALGFVLADPAVTSALIGPRTPDQLASLLAATDVALPHDVVAAVDDVVAPGVTVNPVDNG